MVAVSIPLASHSRQEQVWGVSWLEEAIVVVVVVGLQELWEVNSKLSSPSLLNSLPWLNSNKQPRQQGLQEGRGDPREEGGQVAVVVVVVVLVVVEG